MYIRSLCAAAVVAVGVGQADAATVVTHDIIFTVTYAVDRQEVEIFEEDEVRFENIDTPLAEFWGVPVGSPARGTLTISNDVPNPYGDVFVSLVVAGTTLYNEVADGTFDDFDGIQGISGYLWESIRWQNGSGFLWYTYDGRPNYTFADATITLAPVPLPAAAALLPLGIGALALMRRRRRSLS